MTVDRKAVAQAKRAATRKANERKELERLLRKAHRRLDRKENKR